jgi:hypothetical protein
MRSSPLPSAWSQMIHFPQSIIARAYLIRYASSRTRNSSSPPLCLCGESHRAHRAGLDPSGPRRHAGPVLPPSPSISGESRLHPRILAVHGLRGLFPKGARTGSQSFVNNPKSGVASPRVHGVRDTHGPHGGPGAHRPHCVHAAPGPGHRVHGVPGVHRVHGVVAAPLSTVSTVSTTSTLSTMSTAFLRERPIWTPKG